MKLEEYKKLSEIQLLNELGLQNILEANKAYQNNEIDKDFNNAKLFKPITDSNKELIDRIEKKTDQSDEIIKKITDALLLYNQQPQAQPQAEAQSQDVKEEEQEKVDIEKSSDFVGDIIKGKSIFLYTSKKGDVYTHLELLNLNDLNKFSKKDLQDYLNRPQLISLSKQLTSLHYYRPNDITLKSYLDNLNEYKNKINKMIENKESEETSNNTKPLKTIENKESEETSNNTKPLKTIENKESEETSNNKDIISQPFKIVSREEVKGQGIKKRRNGYKIENEKYGEKIKINMDKLFNNFYVEAWYDDRVVYENQGDKDTVELLTKGRINKKKKYSNLSKQIFNDMMTLSGMIKKRNGKNILLGTSNIILNENDRMKRIGLLRGSIIAGNDNKKIQQELASLSSQENVIQNKNIDTLYNELKTLTPILKTSQGDENVHNQVYNIIDYLRTNRHISRDQYHKYIKKHLM